MSKKIKNEQKKFLGETLNQYDKALDEAINQLDKKNREQNHKISSLVNSFDNEYLEKDVEGNMTTLENSKDGMVIINEIQGNTEVNYCKDGEKELILNGDIDTQGESFVTITEGVDGGLVDVSLEGNTEINLSSTKDPVLVTREFDDINCNSGKLQYTIDDVTTINDEPGKVDIDRIVGDTMVNHAVNGSEELILNAHINESGDNNITLNGVTSDGGLVDVALEGNTMVNVCDQKEPVAITKSYTVETGNYVALQGEYDGKCRPVVTGNTLVNLVSSINYTYDYSKGNHWEILGKTMYPLRAKDYTIILNIKENTLDVDWNIWLCSSSTSDNLYGAATVSAGYTGIYSKKFIPSVNTLDVIREEVVSATSGSITISDVIILEGDYTNKPIPEYFEGLQSSFEDKVVTQEMVDNGEELAENLGKYKVDYVVTGKNKCNINTFEMPTNAYYIGSEFLLKDIAPHLIVGKNYHTSFDYSISEGIKGKLDLAIMKPSGEGLKFLYNFTFEKDDLNKHVYFYGGNVPGIFSNIQIEEGTEVTPYEPYKEYTKTFYLNSPLLERDTIEQQGDNVVHVHRSELRAYQTDDELTLPTDMTNTLVAKATPQYEVISQNDTILCDSYVNGHLDVDSAVPIEKVDFLHFEKDLTYLYANTQYAVQFISDAVSKVDIALGGAELLNQNVVLGINKYTITTPSELIDNNLILNGEGFNASNIVVTEATDQDFGYFEGMKSVGECEDLEVISSNKNLFDINNVIMGAYILGGGVFGNRVSIDTSNPNRAYIMLKVKPNTTYTLKSDGVLCYIRGMITEELEAGEIYSYTNSWSFHSSKNTNYYTINIKPSNDEELTLDMIRNSNIQLEEGNTVTDYIPHQSNTQTLTHEPLRAVGDIKDKYVLIDGKWYIERNCAEVVLDGSDEVWNYEVNEFFYRITNHKPNGSIMSDKIPYGETKVSTAPDNHHCIKLGSSYGIVIRNDDISSASDFKQWLQQNPVTVVYELATPAYEPIDYNPFTVYSDITHISNNSTIPCNMIIKNHGYNMVALKENTLYTLYVDKNTTNALTYRLGDYVEINSLSKFTFTTPATLTDKTLRITGKGNSVKDLMLIEGTPANDPVGYFDGLKSSYECEQVTDEDDVNYGKYKVDVKVVGKNLCPNKFYSGWSNRLVTLGSDDNVVSELIKVKPNSNYTINKADFAYLFKYDSNKEFIGQEVVFQTFNTKNAVYIRMAQSISASDIRPENYNNTIQLEEGNTATEYEPYFDSKQTIYLNSPLLKGDEIVWKDNKIQHYHKMGSVILDGSNDENWEFSSLIGKNLIQLSCPIPNGSIDDDYNVYSNTILGYYGEFRDSMWINKSRLYVRIDKNKLQTQDLQGFKQWLQQNPITVVYELETPYYEEISDYPLKLNVIANSSLSTESTIQVTNISFNIYEETLPYLYPNTKYYITFNADVDRNNIIIDLGGNHVVFDCKVGFNKVEITTPSDTTNLLTFSGTGVNIDHVKVTQQDIDEYFEGMKSVGECEELEITSANSDNTLLNTQQLTHEPLRAVGEVKDRYVLIDNKWYIERRCGEIALESLQWEYNNTITNSGNTFAYTGGITNILVQSQVTKNYFLCNIVEATKVHNHEVDKEQITQFIHSSGIALRISRDKLQDNSVNSLNEFLLNNNAKLVYQLKTPVYEPIDYNPFEVYSDVTHITTNSLIPTNVVVKNHGYNCILKPSTKYTIALNKPNGTISAKLGGSAKVDSTNSVFTITTPSTLNDNVLRLSGSGKVKDIMILEGDKTVNTPSYFEGIESVFEQEYDTEKGKYRVTARVEGNGKESSIIFYLNEPLRGTGTAKDKVFIQDGKVVVQRNCGSVTFDDNDDINKANEGYDSVNNITFSILMDNLLSAWLTPNNILCSTLPSVGHYVWSGVTEGITSDTQKILFGISRKRLKTQDIDGFKQWLQQNPTTIVYALVNPVYEEAECDLSKLVLENYENSSLIFESNIPVSANIKYSGEVPVVTQAKALSSKVDNTTLDINENIIPYMCDIDYRIIELQLNGDTQGEGIELLGIGDIEILGNNDVLFNNREVKKYNYSYDMLKRDILSQRYSREEYQYRLDRYLLAEKISDEEYKELEGLLNNGE